MPQNITDVDTFTDPVTAPADGDPLNAASIINDGLQDLSNRTRRLMSVAEGSQDVQTPQTFTRTVSASWLVPVLNPGAVVQWETDGTEGWRAVAAIVGELRGSLNDLLPEGATVTRARAMVDPITGRSGANRMGLELRRVTYTLPAAPAVKPASDASVSLFATFDDTTADQQMIDSGVISEAISKATTDLVLYVRSGLGGSAGDDVNAIELTFTDPGRRW